MVDILIAFVHWSRAPQDPYRRVPDVFCGEMKPASVAVDWLLMSDIGEVIKKIVNPQTFPDYQIPKKPARRKRRRRPLK
jgi:hypothetical protein